jgi:hypothetical protein
MQELKKDLFKCISDPEVDAICITTNGHWTTSGLAVMGGGCAGEAARRWPEVPVRLGKLLKQSRLNIPYLIGAVDATAIHVDLSNLDKKQHKCLIFSFPTINNLIRGAELNLIIQSAKLMVEQANKYNLKRIIIGRPGVGIGGLKWAEVKIALEPILDDRFVIVSFENEE